MNEWITSNFRYIEKIEIGDFFQFFYPFENNCSCHRYYASVQCKILIKKQQRIRLMLQH